MSATVNERQFSDYFGGCPILRIPGFTHPVKEYYLEDVLQVSKYTPDFKDTDIFRKGVPKDAPGQPRGSGKKQFDEEMAAIQALKSKGYPDSVLQVMKKLDPEKINNDLIVKSLAGISQVGEAGAILVFLPGLMEIAKCLEACQANPVLRASTNGGQYIFSLHSALATEDQTRVFQKPPDGVRKIILATNIAETSITIDDVKWVVDAGRVKENQYNDSTHMQALVEVWTSRASAKQRRGRAGRVSPGHCVRLFSRHVHDNVMKDHQIPEILRVPLEGLVLQVKLLRVAEGPGRSVEQFLDLALEPPSSAAVAR
jgi:ATP-dependent RNA helicase DHX57